MYQAVIDTANALWRDFSIDERVAYMRQAKPGQLHFADLQALASAVRGEFFPGNHQQFLEEQSWN